VHEPFQPAPQHPMTLFSEEKKKKNFEGFKQITPSGEYMIPSIK